MTFRVAGRRALLWQPAKNAQSNIDASDERDLKVLAKVLLAVSDVEIEKLLEQRVYQEVLCEALLHKKRVRR